MAQKRVHLWISGYVQGVGFRAHTQRRAAALGLAGWVRNARSGQVEVVAEGEEERLRELIAWCQRGPGAAEVEDVEVLWEPYRGEFRDFRIVW